MILKVYLPRLIVNKTLICIHILDATMGRELRSIRDGEAMMKSQLEVENTWLRRQLQEMEIQLETMASLSIEAIQCRMPKKSYALYFKEQWLQFQIKTLE